MEIENLVSTMVLEAERLQGMPMVEKLVSFAIFCGALDRSTVLNNNAKAYPCNEQPKQLREYVPTPSIDSNAKAYTTKRGPKQLSKYALQSINLRPDIQQAAHKEQTARQSVFCPARDNRPALSTFLGGETFEKKQ